MNSGNKTQLMHIPVSQIENSPVALRDVKKDTLAYVQLRDSIAQEGILNPVNVRPAMMANGESPKLDSNGNQIYQLVDGLHRLTAARDLRFDTVPAQVLSRSEQEALVSQLVANAQRVETKHAEFARHLVRILEKDRTLTVGELADKLKISPQWLNKRLGLARLSETAAKLVDGGKITVSNGTDLAKLQPPELQEDFLIAAQEDSPTVFAPKVNNRIKQIRDEKRKGQKPGEVQFVATSHFRKKGDVEEEIGAGCPTVAALLDQAGITDPVEAVTFALRWVISLDERSIAEARAREEARKQKAKDEATKRAADRAEEKAAEARAKAEAVTS